MKIDIQGLAAIHWRVTLIFLLCLSSCVQTHDDRQFASTPELDSFREVAIIISQMKKQDSALAFYEPKYRSYPDPTILDQYKYYDFKTGVYKNLGDKKEALYADSMLWVLESKGATAGLSKQYAYAIFIKADMLFDAGNFNEAYEYYYKAKSIAEEENDTCSIAYYMYRIATSLYRTGKYKECIPHYKQSFEYTANCKSNFNIYYRAQEMLDNIGLAYAQLDMHDSALFYYKKAITFIEQEKNSVPASKQWMMGMAAGVVYGNMGTSYEKVGDVEQAESSFLKSISINGQRMYDNRDAQYTRIKLAELYIKKNRGGEAMAILEAISHVQQTIPDVLVEMRLNNLLGEHYKDKDPEKAFAHLHRYTRIKDSMAMSRLQAINMDIDRHVTNLQQATQLTTLRESSSHRQFYLVIILFIVFLLILIFLLVRYNLKRSGKHIRKLKNLNKRMMDQKQKLEKVLSKLEHSDKEKDRILKAVSHDMRSPINSALGLIDMLQNNKQPISDEHAEYVALIKNSCANALAFTKDLLTVATAHEEQLTKARIDIVELLRNNIELLKFRAANKKQELVYEAGAEQIFVALNKEKLTRLVNNIVTNAIKFSPVCTTIEVKVQQHEAGVELTIKDQGIGIPDAMKNKVFDILTEAKRFGTSGEEPYGLGLSISKQIVEAHNGKIWFHSVLGEGTTFYIFLPYE